MRTGARRGLGRAGFGLTAALLGCPSQAPAPTAALPEPTAALRPEAQRGSVPAAAKVLTYELSARLDGDLHRLDGHARLSWRNTSAASVDRIPMHLYMNAFRSPDTTWMLAGRGRHRGHDFEDKAWGYIDVGAVRRVGPGPEHDGVALAFAEGPDPTTLEVTLDRPVAPGETLELQIDFVTQLPEVFARTGYSGPFHMVGQWYPKPGVLDAQGTWHNHVFEYHSEFFADFADFDVTLDVPEDLVVGATGVLTDKRVEDGRQHLSFRAEMVHDFAWAADPRFVSFDEDYEGIRIRQLMLPERAQDARAHADVLTAALGSMQTRYGPYPWSTITVIHPPAGAEGAGGMEYPTLFTTSDILHPAWPLAHLGFEERFSGRFTTIHEFGHQYFQGLLASNEFQEPWLDEGMNTTSNALVLTDIYGPDPWVARFGDQRLFLSDSLRQSLARGATLQPVAATAAQFSPLTGSYGPIVYQKTAALMLTLRNLVGQKAFDAALRDYALAWRFRHPTGDDLRAALIEGLGSRVVLAEAQPEPAEPRVSLDVAEFLDQALTTTRTVDFTVHAIVNREAVRAEGWHRDDQGVLAQREADATAEPVKESVVILHRLGEFLLPVTVEVEFEGGETTRLLWSGRERLATWTFAGQHVDRVRLDPDGDLLLEWNRLDNHRVAPTATRRDDGLSTPLSRMAQAAALALMVAGGP